jgi:hypothetical protein
MHRKHHKTNHVENTEDRAAGERVSEHCVVIVNQEWERTSQRRWREGRREEGTQRTNETHVTSPVWFVTGRAERQHRRKIDRRAIVSEAQ